MKDLKKEKRVGIYLVTFLGRYTKKENFIRQTGSEVKVFYHGKEKRALAEQQFEDHQEGSRKYFLLNNEDEIKKFINK